MKFTSFGAIPFVTTEPLSAQRPPAMLISIRPGMAGSLASWYVG
jgi:hypothetical protein